ncbi:unnamed protein product [Clonostachys solani]|uniref:Uncharacterized protein n=1 Tax=Clonostachys solani TaxID=160281 RepID=A0A9P0EM25_9HYPO|nr:unnamed protein product [Clonostachys solani]
MRLTAGILNAEGVITQFPKTSDFGMPGFFGRDISKLTKMISVSSGRPCPLRKAFMANSTVEILCPSDYLSTANDEQTHATDQFIQGLELSFKTRRSMISIANLWKEDMPDGIENRDIAAYLKTAGICPLIRDSEEVSEALGDDDRAESTASSSSPALKVLAKLDFNKRISEEKQAECARRCEVYRDWILSTIFETDSENKLKFMVFPALEGKSNRGDEPEPALDNDVHSLDDLLNGYAPTNMSSILQAPELTVVGV